MISNLKQKLIILIITLMVVLSNVSLCFAATVDWNTSIGTVRSVGNAVTMDGDVMSSSEGGTNFLLRFLIGEAGKSYTFYWYEPLASGNDALRLSFRSGISGSKGYVLRDGTVSSSTGTSLVSLKDAFPESEYLARFVSVTIPDDLELSLSGTDSNNYYLSMSINGAFSIDFSKMFVVEGTIEDIYSEILPTARLVDQNITIMPGYIFVCEVVDSGILHLAASGLPDSPTVFSSREWTTNVQYGQTLTVPSSGNISSSAFLRYVVWNKVNPNILGSASVGRSDITYSRNDGRYLVIVNPYNFIVEDGGGIKGFHTNINPQITARFSSGVYSYRLYKTSQLWNDVSLTGSTYFDPIFDASNTQTVGYDEVDISTDEVINDTPIASLPDGSMSGTDSSSYSLGGASDIFSQSAQGLKNAFGEHGTFVTALTQWLSIFPPEVWSVLSVTALVVCAIGIVKAIL